MEGREHGVTLSASAESTALAIRASRAPNVLTLSCKNRPPRGTHCGAVAAATERASEGAKCGRRDAVQFGAAQGGSAAGPTVRRFLSACEGSYPAHDWHLPHNVFRNSAATRRTRRPALHSARETINDNLASLHCRLGAASEQHAAGCCEKLAGICGDRWNYATLRKLGSGPMATELRLRVKAVNDLYRTALLNRKYYAYRLSAYQAWNRTIDIAIAIGSSATVAGWGVWRLRNIGATSWGVLASVAAVASVLKPILQLPKAIERYSKLHLGYCSLYYDLDLLIFEIQQTHQLSPSNWKSFLQYRKRHNDLGLSDELHPRTELLKQCQKEVLKEIPAGTLWLPMPAVNTAGESQVE